MAVPADDDLIIDKALLVEPEISNGDEEGSIDEFGFDTQQFAIEGEGIIDDEEFDADREHVYESYEEDPSLLDEEDDM